MTPELIKLLDELEDARLMADTHHTSVGSALGKAIDWIQNSETVTAIRPDPRRAAFMFGDEGGGMASFYFRSAADGQKWFEAILAIEPPVSDAQVPIDMLLYCPMCGAQHIDQEEGGFVHNEHGSAVGDLIISWSNPPHRSHLCQSCGTIWRPADVATNGVKKIETRGKADTWEATLSTSSMALNSMTPHQFVMQELYEFQEATGCDVASQLKDQKPFDVAGWIRNNYQDYPTIDSLCTALDAAINTSRKTT